MPPILLRRKARKSVPYAPVWTACAFLLTGCLYSTHHFNDGRLLEPGKTSLALGSGVFHALEYGCPDSRSPFFIHETKDSTGAECVRYTGPGPIEDVDTVAHIHPFKRVFKGSLGYRLGAHGPFGPFTGAEIGLHLEAPTNPASAELDLKAGLPAPKGRPYHHSLSIGFGMGAWADNSYFCEYAVSRDFGAGGLFAGYRATLLATQMADLKGSERERRFASRRRFLHQASLGFSWTLPPLPVLPDFLVPLATLTYPIAPVGGDDPPPAYLLDDHVWDFGLGMGWSFR